MAFDMYCRNRKESIGHHEEEFFSYINENESYPELNAMWKNLYDGPRIDSDQSNRIVHELVALRAILSDADRKRYSSLVDRLQLFFSHSYLSKEFVRCVGD